uniref:Uncharacterized protein n=1 Tax=Oryza punctata TaxID=4537 RepID=A0A0E0JWV4_ORYPU
MFLSSPIQIYCSSMIVKLILGFLWCLVHLVISFFGSLSHLRNDLECYLISFKLLPKYRNLHLERLAFLGVVVDSREAKKASKVKQLLCWFSTIGIKYLILYDIEGVLKELIQPGIETSTDGNPRNSLIPKLHAVDMEGCLWSVYLALMARKPSPKQQTYCVPLAATLITKVRLHLQKLDMTHALKAVGIGGPEPDLLLVYMGPLDSMKYGTIVKDLYRFSRKYQNYGKSFFFILAVWHCIWHRKFSAVSPLLK